MRRGKALQRGMMILTAATLIAAGGAAYGQAAGHEPVRFAIIGDRTGNHQPGLYEQALAEIEWLKPELIITVGDHIEGYTEDTAQLNQEWQEYKLLVQGLDVPLYLTPGNHDVLNQTERDIYLRQIGKPNYSFDYKGIHFVVCDNAVWGKSSELPSEELAWLADDLQKSQNARQTLVFMHQPFWYNTTALGKADTLHSLFRAYGVDAVFTGHYHEYFSGTYDGIIYTGIGSSGGEAGAGPTGLAYHFCWVTVDDKGIAIAPIKLGSVLPWDEVTAADLRQVDRMKNIGLSCSKVLVGDSLRVAEQQLTVTVHNLSSQPLRDTLIWNADSGWAVRPDRQAIDLPPGDSTRITFAASSPLAVFTHLPYVTVNFPYAPGKQTPLSAYLHYAQRQYCDQAQKPPVIDGNLNEALWSGQPAGCVTLANKEKETPDTVTFYFAYDRVNLYLAAKCYDRATDSLQAEVTERDGGVYGEDCIGYFLQPDTGKAIAYQIYFSPRGTIFDQKLTMDGEGNMNGDKSWNGTYKIKTSRGKDFWTVEAALPLAQFGVAAQSGDAWGLNFRRKLARYDESVDWQTPIDYNPATFGMMMMK